jgi:MFS transporter, DHA2 family, multidrug resistance protein
MTASYDGLAQSKTGHASALMTAARNTGSSIVLQRADASRAVPSKPAGRASDIPSSAQYQDTLQRVTSYFTAYGGSLVQADDQTIQWTGQQMQIQASFPAYMDAFWVLMLVSLAAAVPPALTLRKVKPGGAVHVGH